MVSKEDPASQVAPKSTERFWLIASRDGIKEFIARNGEFTVNISLIEGRDAHSWWFMLKTLTRCIGGVSVWARFGA